MSLQHLRFSNSGIDFGQAKKFLNHAYCNAISFPDFRVLHHEGDLPQSADVCTWIRIQCNNVGSCSISSEPNRLPHLSPPTMECGTSENVSCGQPSLEHKFHLPRIV